MYLLYNGLKSYIFWQAKVIKREALKVKWCRPEAKWST